MDGFNAFNGQPASNGSGSQGDNGSQGLPPTNGQNAGEIAPGFQNDSARQTLWMGELAGWMDEAFIRNLFSNAMNENVQVKVIRDRHSGNAGYCFVEFASPEGAQKALALNGTSIPQTDRAFRLNWASGGGLVDRRDDRSPEYSIFVGDLGHEVTEFVLVALFQNRFPSCKSAKIMTDQQTGQSRGYGFVRFSSEEDQQRALTEMQGVYCGNRPMRVSPATPKNRGHQGNHYGQFGGAQPMVAPQAPHHGAMGGGAAWMGAIGAQPQQNYQFQQPAAFNPMTMNQFTDPNNTTVFVGGLSGYVTEDELRSFFQGFGEITYVKIPPGKGCGFVQFVHRHAAEMAINQMQGYPIGNSRVRLSWGRSQNNSGVGTPYRPAPPPPHYFPPGPGGPPGPGPGPVAGGPGAYSAQVPAAGGPGSFNAPGQAAGPGSYGGQGIDPTSHILHPGVLRFWRYGLVS
ncbi:RNA-binding domain-containing protein [Astrocystis sublimbata]|nr:RNA-binding domain-containing protein [Astrocystis sublimbata]